MDRDRRLSDQENPFWANPCDYATIPSSGSIEYGSNLAQNVATLARNTLNIAEKYKDELAQKIHQYDNFTLLLDNWKSYKWMYKWDSKDIVPPEKVFGSSMSEEYLANLMSKIDTALPSMYRGMKMVLAGLHAISKELPGIDNESLRQKLYSTSLGVRSVACSLHDVMISRKLDIAPLLDSEIPRLELKTRAEDTFLIYRDTLIYLSYLEEVFEMMSNGS